MLFVRKLVQEVEDKKFSVVSNFGPKRPAGFRVMTKKLNKLTTIKATTNWFSYLVLKVRNFGPEIRILCKKIDPTPDSEVWTRKSRSKNLKVMF